MRSSRPHLLRLVGFALVAALLSWFAQPASAMEPLKDEDLSELRGRDGIVLSAHLELNDFDHWPDILATARDELEHDHGIRHATLQPEFQGEDCFCSLEHA